MLVTGAMLVTTKHWGRSQLGTSLDGELEKRELEKRLFAGEGVGAPRSWRFT